MKLEDDKLDRAELLDNLMEIFQNFGNQDGHGLTMIINGKYGTGKSTLLDFIIQQNEQNKEFNIVYYDAWESNYFENPIIPLLYSISKLKSKGGRVKKVAKNVLKALPKIFTNTLTNAHAVDLTPLFGETDICDEFDKYKKAVDGYKKVLYDFCQQKKTILLIDELDRCLPEYQIKVLESLYHMFDIPNLIVVIALDKGQLEESIRNKFGEYTDTYGYLSKFIQYEIDLPCESAYEYAKALMSFRSEYDNEIKSIISDMFQAVNLSIREIKLLVQQLNLICKERKDYYRQILPYSYYYPIVVSFLLILRYVDKNLYNKFFNKPLQHNYNSQKIALKDSRFSSFLAKIRETNFNKVVESLLVQPLGQAAMLQVINLFDNVNNIDENDLSKYIRIDNPNQVSILLKDSRLNDWHFPDSINTLIKQLQIIK